jgi:hypothetical protein
VTTSRRATWTCWFVWHPEWARPARPLVDDLERVLGVRVDVVPESDLKRDLRARVEAEAVPLYEFS